MAKGGRWTSLVGGQGGGVKSQSEQGDRKSLVRSKLGLNKDMIHILGRRTTVNVDAPAYCLD